MKERKKYNGGRNIFSKKSARRERVDATQKPIERVRQKEKIPRSQNARQTWFERSGIGKWGEKKNFKKPCSNKKILALCRGRGG